MNVRLVTWLVGPIAFCGATPAAGQLAPALERGRQIYERGASPSKSPIIAVLGRERTEANAAVLFCASCHGFDGQGRSEGGVTPSNITWEALTKLYSVAHPNGRKHQPYTELLLARAITQGIDPAGNPLNASMPRYRLSQPDLADLVAYLKTVGSSLDIGLSSDSIRIGTLLPPGPQMAAMSTAIRKVLTAYAEDINRRGGVYNRRLEILFAEQPEAPADRARALRGFVEQQRIFALIACYLAGAEEEMALAAREAKVPLIGAFSFFPQVASPPNPYVFYLHPGLAGEGNALATFAIKKFPAGSMRAVIVHSEEMVSRQAADTINEQFHSANWKAIDEISVAAGSSDFAAVTKALADGNPAAVFFLVPGAAAQFFLSEGGGLATNQAFFLPGSLATAELFHASPNLNNRIFLSFAMLPADQTPQGMAEYKELAAGHALPAEHLAAQLTALVSAKVLVEGLNVAGRSVSRRRLIETLEGLYEFSSGLVPPLSFGPNRRIGALGSHIVAIDLPSKRFIPVAEWVGPN